MQEEKNRNRNNCCHWRSFLSCIRQLLFKSFCASLSQLQLLALFFLSSITYIPFSCVPVSCKFIGIVKSLDTHWACLHSHLSLAQECALEINSLYMLCVSWVGSHHRAAVLCTRDFLCEAELKDALQCNPSTGHCILCINCFSLHTHSCWIALLANTCSCMQSAKCQMLSLACQNYPFPSILMCLWTHSWIIFVVKVCDEECSFLAQELETRLLGSILWNSNRSVIQFSVTNAYDQQKMQYVHCISHRVGRVNPIITREYFHVSVFSLHTA